MIQSILVGQLITLKAKVVHLTDVTDVKKRNLKYRNATIVDPSGSINLTLWEDHCESVTEGETYIFKNIRIKENLNNEVSLEKNLISTFQFIYPNV